MVVFERLKLAERFIAFAFLALTAFATLGTGEHWFIDLVVAFPFALLMYSLCAYQVSWKDSRRITAILSGLGATLAWLVMLRYGTKLFWASPIVPWALSAATITCACIGYAKLDHADAREMAGAVRGRVTWFRLDSAVARPE